MPDAFTQWFAFTKPEVGASRDTWGAKTNANWDVVDEFLAMALPVGAIFDFAGPYVPPGYLNCDGRLISRTTYSQLFTAIGTYWGAGDGSTTFALPPTPGRTLIGAGHIVDEMGYAGDYPFSRLQGAQVRAILQSNLPNYPIGTDAQGGHNHTGPTTPAGAHSHTTDAQGTHQHNTGGTGFGTVAVGDHVHGGTTDTQGTHQHWVNAWGTSGGGALASPGGVATNGGVTTDPAGAHAHNLSMAGAGGHGHYIFWDGNHAHNVYGVGDHQHWIQWDGNHAHTVWLGGGGAGLDIRQPLMVVTKIIFAGQQASARVLTAAAAAPLRRLSAPLRGGH